MSKKPLVYLAGPYSRGDSALNVRSQQELFHELSALYSNLFVCFAPLLTHYQHIAFPRTYEQWLAYDFDIIHHCDALLRFDAAVDYDDVLYFQHESPGADREIKLAEEIGIPVFTNNVDGLVEWARQQQGQSSRITNCKTGRCRLKTNPPSSWPTTDC